MSPPSFTSASPAALCLGSRRAWNFLKGERSEFFQVPEPRVWRRRKDQEFRQVPQPTWRGRARNCCNFLKTVTPWNHQSVTSEPPTIRDVGVVRMREGFLRRPLVPKGKAGLPPKSNNSDQKRGRRTGNIGYRHAWQTNPKYKIQAFRGEGGSQILGFGSTPEERQWRRQS